MSFTSVWSTIVNLVNFDVLSKLDSSSPSQVLSIMDLLYGFMLASNNCKIDSRLISEWQEVFNRALFSGFPTSRAMAANSISLLLKENISISLVTDILAFVLENEDPLFQRAVSVIGIDISSLLLEKLFNSKTSNDFSNISKLIISNANSVTKSLMYLPKILEYMNNNASYLQFNYLELLNSVIEQIHALNFSIEASDADKLLDSLFQSMLVFLKLGIDSIWVENFISISRKLIKFSSNQYNYFIYFNFNIVL